MIPLRSLISSVLMFSLLAPLFNRPLQQLAVAQTKEDETGLQFRLSNGIDRPEVTKPATATELSQSETESILKRLPPMKIDPSNVREFALREGTLLPPRTGNIVET